MKIKEKLKYKKKKIIYNYQKKTIPYPESAQQENNRMKIDQNHRKDKLIASLVKQIAWWLVY